MLKSEKYRYKENIPSYARIEFRSRRKPNKTKWTDLSSAKDHSNKRSSFTPRNPKQMEASSKQTKTIAEFLLFYYSFVRIRKRVRERVSE